MARSPLQARYCQVIVGQLNTANSPWGQLVVDSRKESRVGGWVSEQVSRAQSGGNGGRGLPILTHTLSPLLPPRRAPGTLPELGMAMVAAMRCAHPPLLSHPLPALPNGLNNAAPAE